MVVHRRVQPLLRAACGLIAVSIEAPRMMFRAALGCGHDMVPVGPRICVFLDARAEVALSISKS